MLKKNNILLFVFLFIAGCVDPIFNAKNIKRDEIIVLEDKLPELTLEDQTKEETEASSKVIKREKSLDQKKNIHEEVIINNIVPKSVELDIKIIDKFIANKTIKIGLLVPLSGSAKEIGVSIYNASEMAVFESGSKNIILLPRDSGDNIETALAAAKKLEKEGISILVGPLFSFQAKIIRENIDSSIPVFSFTNDESITRQGIWSFGFSPQQQIKAVIKEIKNNKINDIAVIVPNTAYGEVAMKTMTSQQLKKNIHITKIFRYFPESNDLSHLNKSSNFAKNINFEGLLILASGSQLREIASRVQYIGVDPKKVKFFGLSGWNSTNIFGEPSLFGGYFVAPDQTAYEAFVSRYHKIYGDWPSEVSALGYDILALSSLLIDGAKKQSEIVSLATSSDGYKGLFGFFKLTSTGKIYRKYVSYKVLERSFLKQREIMPEID